jgi:hypothetical protein
VGVNMPLYLVETVSIFRQRYVIDCKSAGHANDTVVMNTTGGNESEFKEFSQKHVGEEIVTTREITETEALQLCDEDNEYASVWNDEHKKKVFFTVVNYGDDKE